MCSVGCKRQQADTTDSVYAGNTREREREREGERESACVPLCVRVCVWKRETEYLCVLCFDCVYVCVTDEDPCSQYYQHTCCGGYCPGMYDVQLLLYACVCVCVCVYDVQTCLWVCWCVGRHWCQWESERERNRQVKNGDLLCVERGGRGMYVNVFVSSFVCWGGGGMSVSMCVSAVVCTQLVGSVA